MITRRKDFIFQIFFLIFAEQVSLANTINSTPVGPGIIHHHEFREVGPWQIHVLEIDMTNEWIKLETVKANDRLVGRERISSMAARNVRELHRVVGAINGDFYEAGGVPVGAQVLDGILLKRPTTRSVFGFSPLNKPLIDIVFFEGTVSTATRNSLAINGVNEIRGMNKLILYNKYYGSTTRTNIWGTEIIANYITIHPLVNDTVYVVVIAKDSIMTTGHGNNAIPTNGIVLSGHDTARSFLNEDVFIGDTLSIILQLPPAKESIIELIGGTPCLIRNGVATVEWEQEHTSQSFVYDRHPRTAVGFNQDSTKLYFFTVDGRQPGYSVGMSLFELADYMLEWGVYQGVNLDGGGSTTMIVRGDVVNNPSDVDGERSVANALMVISTAPTGSLSLLKISPQEVFVFPGNQVQFSVTGFDKYYNTVAVSIDLLNWNCDQIIGRIDESGLFTAARNLDSGFVYAFHGKFKDSTKVYISKAISNEKK